MTGWLSPRVGFALVAALYLLSFPYHPGLRSPNELCRLWQSRALVDFKAWNINGVLQQRGMVGDLSCTAVVRENGRDTLKPCVGPDAPRSNVVAVWYYPSKAPLVSILGAPVYAALEALSPTGQVSELSQVLWSRLFVTIFPALGLLWLVRRFLSTFVEPETADLFTVVYAMGTMAYSYGQTFLSHQLTAVLLFAAFFCAWKVERGEWKAWGYALAGLAAGAAVAAEYTAALGVLCVASYTVAARWRRWGALAQAAGLVALGSAPMLGLLLWYHAQAFGSPFASGYKFLNDAAYMGWHQGGFLGIRLPDARAFVLSFFSPLRGFFAISPFLVVALWGVREVRAKDRAFFVSLVALVVSHAYFTASFTYDSWGWTVGPRHLTGTLPFLMLPAALVFERLAGASALKASVLAGLGAVSVLAAGLAGFIIYVPDDVSTSIWGLSLPMLAEGFWPVSWLAAWIPNPAPGALLVGLLVTLVGWVLSRAWKAGARLVPVALVVMLVHLLLLKGLAVFTAPTDPGAHDEHAKKFLQSVWLAPNGKRIEFSGP